ncbi:L,D-transpeptidase family protein [Paucilactobacillus kaifaensis]|uniref:L,D-transpeptidase family protein n=1 Tax=Paucilactobacillus kaifaensis TaxID=2559921 RepID=UPI0010F851B9|nr:L,D-transpeptidase family protein [Paucilactobacillus kaifaensis]
MRTKRVKQSRHIWLWLIPIILIVIYAGGSIYYQHHFLPKTEVFGIKVAGKTNSGATDALKQRIKTTKYTFKDGNKTVLTATGSQLGINRNFNQILTNIKKQQNAWSWPVHLFAKPTINLTKSTAIIDDTTLNQFSRQATITLNKHRTATQNASLSFKHGKLITAKEVAGNQISNTKLAALIKSDVQANKNSINLKHAYVKPSITTNMQKFQQLKAKLTKISKVSGIIRIQQHKVKITKNEVQGWIDINGTSMSISQAKVGKTLDKLNDKYATYNKTRHFQSTASGTVSVPAGIYGWSINQKKQIPVLVAAVKDGKTFDTKVITKGSGYHADGTDIGNTYIEVDKQNQMEYYYKDGKLEMSSAVVTGNPTKGKATPSGVYDIWSKQRDATLRGENYATKVSYWMPVDDTGVGLHDSPWQPKYGGDWYLSHGSHGCVNNPPEFIAKLYDAVSVGTPVIIF